MLMRGLRKGCNPGASGKVEVLVAYGANSLNYDTFLNPLSY